MFRIPNGKMVSCGDWKLSQVDTYEVSLPISEIINHPDYNVIPEANDIAVIKVEGSFTCSQGKIYPACLPNKNVGFMQVNIKGKYLLFRNTPMLDGKTHLYLDGAQSHQVDHYQTHFSMSRFLQCLMLHVMQLTLTMVR